MRAAARGFGFRSVRGDADVLRPTASACARSARHRCSAGGRGAPLRPRRPRGSIASSRSRHAERVTARRSAGPPPPPGRPAGSGTSYVARRARPRLRTPNAPPADRGRWRRRLFIRVRVFVRERTRVILRWPWGRLTVSDVTSPGSRPAQRWHVRLSLHTSRREIANMLRAWRSSSRRPCTRGPCRIASPRMARNRSSIRGCASGGSRDVVSLRGRTPG